MSRTVSFKTVGCRLNQAETARMAAQFEAAGYDILPFGRPVDVCVVHTCAVTERAEKDCIRIARAARRSPYAPRVVLAGCAVEISGPRLRDSCQADLLVGQKEKFRLPDLLGAEPPRARSRPISPPLPRCAGTRALVAIQNGCGFGCSYCVVPRARGSPTSRSSGEILDEIRRLADAGFQEVVLAGANLGCYRDGKQNLVALLEAIENMRTAPRIRLSSIEPSTTERPLLEFMAGSSRLCRHLHVPLQSGDDRILAAMGRRYSVAEYRAFVEHAAAKIPDLGLGSDLIAGFPGEDEEAFRNTVETARDLPFSYLHVFPYSPRPGTRAAAMENRVPQKEKRRRTALLIGIGEEKQRRFVARFVGKPVSVLVEQISGPDSGTGWTREYVEARVRRAGLQPNRIVEFVPSRVEGTCLTT